MLLAVIAISLQAVQGSVDVKFSAGRVVASNSSVELSLNLSSGSYSIDWGSHASLPNVNGFVRLEDQRIRKTNEFGQHLCDAKSVTRVKDAFGEGVRIDLVHRQPNEPDLIHSFWVYSKRPEIYIQLAAKSPKRIASNYFSPIAADQPDSGLNLAKGDPLQVLFVPFDNDMFVRYHSQNWGAEADTFETTAIYDNESRNGLVIGSIDHDTWKTGIAIRNRAARRIGGLTVYGGAAGHWSHDQDVHGLVAGQTIRTARIFVGWFPDWRDGLEKYGQANALVKPALEWSGGVPFGWNSWSAHKMSLSNEKAKAASSFLSQTLAPAGFQSSTPTFVNLDAFWDNMKEPELQAFVENAHKGGLRAGIYWTPFAAWGNDLNTVVEGTNGLYRYSDLVIKNGKGQPLNRVDNGWPLDPTHPGTKMRNAYHYSRFVQWGFDYVKLDFMSHGSFEGQHFDKSVQTGVQAYNIGMKDVVAAFDPKKIGRPFFISLSIAPLFPHGYAHSRRMSCDAFSNIGQTEYMLNSLTYGWWAHGALYRFNDPDHLPVYRSDGENPVTALEGQSRLVSGVVAGGMLLNGDDLTDESARRRVQALFTNGEMLTLARKGLSFRPVEGNTGSGASDTFVLFEPDSRTYYLACFNFTASGKASKSVDLARAGIPADKRYLAFDLANGKSAAISRVLRVDLEPAGCALVRLKEQ
jgi:alpha-galactosidase